MNVKKDIVKDVGTTTAHSHYPKDASVGLYLFYLAPDQLKPWPDNPRSHSDKQLHKLKSSIQNFGFTAPVLADERHTILSGHGRVQAAIDLGLERIPVRTITGLSDTQKRAYVLADNKIAELSSWDDSLLKSEMQLLLQDEFSIEATGFTTAEVDLMFDIEGSGDAKCGGKH